MFSLESLKKSVEKPKGNLKPKIEGQTMQWQSKKEKSLNKIQITACCTLDINYQILKYHLEPSLQCIYFRNLQQKYDSQSRK